MLIPPNIQITHCFAYFWIIFENFESAVSVPRLVKDRFFVEPFSINYLTYVHILG